MINYYNLLLLFIFIFNYLHSEIYHYSEFIAFEYQLESITFFIFNQELHHHIRFVYHDVEMVNAISTLNGERQRVVDNGGRRTSSYLYSRS